MPRESEERIVRFPFKGINVDMPRTEQPPDTCVDAQNVRVHDSLDRRIRGGMRPGVSRYVNTVFVADKSIQLLNYVVTIANTAPASTSLSYRTINGLTVSNGTAFKFDSASKTASTVTGARTLSATVPFIFSTVLFNRIYIADGTSYKIWVADNNTLTDWTPTGGSLPGTDGTVVPRLVETWRGRIVLAGLRTDPHNWFMSALGDPLDWDYAPAETSSTQAFQGALSNIGKIQDVVNCILPYSDDVLIFGCDHSIWQLSGDPGFGGTLDMLSDTVGMAFGRPYCQDPQGNIYFFSSRGNVYAMPGGGGNPQSITEGSVYNLISNTNLNTTFVQMEWDEEQKGMYLFLTPFQSGNTDHWFWDSLTGGWFKDRFADNDIGPTMVKIFDGDDADDRVILLGGRDSRIRQIDIDAADDDGTAMVSFVIIGPEKAQEGQRAMVLTELQALTDQSSETIKYEVLSGDIPDDALDQATAAFTGDGTWEGGLGVTRNPRKRGYYFYYKVGTTDKTAFWSMERINAKYSIVTRGRGRTRQFEDYVWVPETSPFTVTNTNLLGHFVPNINMELTGTAIDSWEFELGDVVNAATLKLTDGTTKPVLNSKDALINNVPSISANSTGQVVKSNTGFHDLSTISNGFLTTILYGTVADGDQAHVIKISGDGTTSAAYVSISFSVNDSFGAIQYNVLKGDGSSLSSIQIGNLDTLNSVKLVTIAFTGSRRIIRINGAEVGNSAFTNGWLSNIQTNSLLTYGFESGNGSGERRLGALSIYTVYDASVVNSVEQAYADYYGVSI